MLAKQVKYFKETEGGRKDMCKAVEELAEKRADERAMEEKNQSVARAFYYRRAEFRLV